MRRTYSCDTLNETPGPRGELAIGRARAGPSRSVGPFSSGDAVFAFLGRSSVSQVCQLVLDPCTMGVRVMIIAIALLPDNVAVPSADAASRGGSVVAAAVVPPDRARGRLRDGHCVLALLCRRRCCYSIALLLQSRRRRRRTVVAMIASVRDIQRDVDVLLRVPRGHYLYYSPGLYAI